MPIKIPVRGKTLRKGDEMDQSMFYSEAIRDFVCIAGACEDHCCRNTVRSLYIDKSAVEKYKTIAGELGQTVNDSVEERDGHHFHKVDENGRCRLLDEFGFCSLQLEAGDEYLCSDCKQFPRNVGYFNGTMEPSLFLSCPEAVRRVLFNGWVNSYETRIVTGAEPPKEPPAQYEADEQRIRDFLFEILQRQDFTILDKLTYMGLVMRSLSKFVKGSGFSAAVSTTVSGYRNNLNTPGTMYNIRQSLIGVDQAARNNALSQVLKVAGSVAATYGKPLTDIENTKFYELISEFKEAALQDVLDEGLLNAYDRLVVPYINGNTTVFINYLLYTMHDTKLTKNVTDFAGAYTGFIGEFITLLLFTAGIFHGYEEIGDEEMTAAIYLFQRKVIPNPEFREEINLVFRSESLATALGMLGAVK